MPNERSETQQITYCRSPFIGTTRRGKPIEAQSRAVAAGSCVYVCVGGQGGCSLGVGGSFWGDQVFWNWTEVVAA